MQLLMTSEARFERTPDGAIWAAGPWGRQLWNRYLTVFNQVRVMARVQAVREPSDGLVTIDPAGVSFVPLDSYSGLTGLLRNVRCIDAAAAAYLKEPTAIILRLPELPSSARSRGRNPSSFCALMNHWISFGAHSPSSRPSPLTMRRITRSWSSESMIWKPSASSASRQ